MLPTEKQKNQRRKQDLLPPFLASLAEMMQTTT